jgi:hypothetical protein
MVTKGLATELPTFHNFKKALRASFRSAVENGIQTLVMPKIGCKLDQLNWPEVEAEIRDNARRHPSLQVRVFELPSSSGGDGSAPARGGGTLGGPDGDRGGGGSGGPGRDTSSGDRGGISGEGGNQETRGGGGEGAGLDGRARDEGDVDGPPSDPDGDSSSSGSVTSTGRSHSPSEPESAGEDDPSLRDRLREAMFHARARAGRLSPEEKAVAEVMANAWAAALRKEAKKMVTHPGLFPLREQVSMDEGVVQIPAGATVEQVFRAAFGLGVSIPSPKEPPSAPLEPEGVTDGDATVVAPPGPLSTAAWVKERLLQNEAEWQAGKIATHSLAWAAERPSRPSVGTHLRWGPRVEFQSDQDRADWASVLYKDLMSGALRACAPDEVVVETPVFLVRHPVSGKLRLVHDLRAINCRLRPPPYMVYERAAAALKRGTVAAKIDLMSAFRHVGVTAADQPTLAFRIGGVYLCWTALPFGLSESPVAFSSELQKVLLGTRAKGVVLVVYVDDILVIAEDPASLDKAVATLLQDLAGAGWRIALDKAFLHATSKTIFLGIVVDLVNDSLRVSHAKARKLKDLCTALLQHKRISLTSLQKIGGVLAFLSVANPLCRFARTAINLASAEAARMHSGSLSLKGLLRDEITFWATHALSLPEFTSPRTATCASVVTDASGPPSLGWGGVWWAGVDSAPDINQVLDDLRGNPGSVLLGGTALAGSLKVRSGVGSSTAWEVQALYRFLVDIEKRSPGSLSGVKVTWYCDSQPAVFVVRSWRTKSIGVADELGRLFELCSKYRCLVEPLWVARDLGWQPIADVLSRVRWEKKSAEYTLLESDRLRVIAELGAADRDFDLFAASGNNAYANFATRFPTIGARTDAFRFQWSGLKAWAFPPFGELSRVASMVSGAPNIDVVIVCPDAWDVPPQVPVVGRVPLGGVHLVNVEGAVMKDICPTPLAAIHVRSG